MIGGDSLPLNRLEVAIAEAKAGRIPLADMLAVLLASDLVLPSAAPVAADGAGLRPVLFAREGAEVVACFTGLERLRGLDHLAPYALVAPARAWLPRMGGNRGLAVNPGQPLGFEIDAHGLRRAVSDLGPLGGSA